MSHVDSNSLFALENKLFFEIYNRKISSIVIEKMKSNRVFDRIIEFFLSIHQIVEYDDKFYDTSNVQNLQLIFRSYRKIS